MVDTIFLHYQVRDQILIMTNTNEPAIDREWNAIVARAKTLMPDDSDINRELLEIYQTEGESPRGCSITNGTDCLRPWRVKMYIGGKQRVLGYGTCYQCARLYDAAHWRFSKYRTERNTPGQTYNFGEAQAGDDNMHADIQCIVCDMEDLLLKRGLLRTPEQRESDQKSRKAAYHAERYTTKGRIEKMMEQIFGMLESMGEQFEKLNRKLDAIQHPPLRITPGELSPHIHPAWATAPYPPVFDPPLTAPGPGYVGDDDAEIIPDTNTCKAPDSV